MKYLSTPDKTIENILDPALRKFIINNSLHDLEDEEAEILLHENDINRYLTSFLLISMNNRDNCVYQNCTTCVMHNLGLGHTKYITEDLDKINETVGNFKYFRKVVNERIKIIIVLHV